MLRTAILVVSVLLLWAYTPSLVAFLSGSHAIPDKGQFGDQFGWLTSLFTGLAVVGAFVTLRLQSKQLQDQQQELLDQRRHLREQAFDNTFFNLLNLRNSILVGIVVDVGEKAWHGHRCLHYIKERWRDHGSDRLDTANPQKEQMETIYKGFWEEWRKYLEHHWLTLEALLRLLEEASHETKAKYIKILNSQLSPSERALLLVHCVSTSHDSKRLTELAAKYKVFDSLTRDQLCHPAQSEFMHDLVTQGKHLRGAIEISSTTS